MIYCLEIKLNNGDEYDQDKKFFDPIFSKDFDKLNKIKSDLEKEYANLKKGILFIKLEKVIPKKEIKREEISKLKKDISEFFKYD